MKNISVLILVLSILFCVCTAHAENSLQQFMPSEKVPEDWKQKEAQEITEANLKECSDNAAAEKLIGYGFVKAYEAVFEPVEDASVSIKVSIADMGNPENAFGVYTTVRTPMDTFNRIGSQSIHQTRSVDFWLKNYYVRLQATADGLQVQMNQLAQEIAREIGPAESRFPDILNHMVPEPGDWVYRKHSLRLIARDLFGMKFLDWVYTADYQLGEQQTATFCILKRDDSKETKEIFDKCRKQFEEVGNDITESDLGQESLISKGDAGYHWIVLQENVLFAVTGFYETEKVKPILVETLAVNVDETKDQK